MAVVAHAAVKAANKLVRERNNYRRRLRQIAEIIERVDDRCMAVDGPVTPTKDEMTSDEFRKIYHLASGNRSRK